MICKTIICIRSVDLIHTTEIGNSLQSGSSLDFLSFPYLFVLKTCMATENPEFPQVGPKSVRDQETFLRIFAGRVEGLRL